jgi:hypothetical protein
MDILSEICARASGPGADSRAKVSAAGTRSHDLVTHGLSRGARRSTMKEETARAETGA